MCCFNLKKNTALFFQTKIFSLENLYEQRGFLWADETIS